MARDRVRIVILFEDDAQRRFAKRLVEKFNLHPVRFEPCVDYTRVVDKLVAELRESRSKMSFQRGLGLLVFIDGDLKGTGKNAGFEARLKWLEDTVAESETGGPRQDEERIAFLLPTRTIETWYVHLTKPEERPVSEVIAYKDSVAWRTMKDDLGTASKAAVDAWYPAQQGEPLSVKAARDELKRLQ